MRSAIKVDFYHQGVKYSFEAICSGYFLLVLIANNRSRNRQDDRSELLDDIISCFSPSCTASAIHSVRS